MIKEIVQFIDALPQAVFSKNLRLREGLYFFLEIEEENGNPILKNIESDGKLREEDFGIFSASTEMNPFFEKCLDLQVNSVPVSPAKIFNPNKKIFGVSCSPFIVAFTKKNFDKYDKKILIKELSDQYFKKAEEYCTTDYQKKKFRPFRNFLIGNIYEFLNDFPEYLKAKGSFSVNIFLKNIAFSEFLEVHEKYVEENVFNKGKYNKKWNNEIYGISDSLSGFNDSKRFLKHQTSPLPYNYRVKRVEAQDIWKFFKLQQNKQIPNPCPIFVDKKELNSKIITLYQNEKVLSYSGLINDIFKTDNQESLQDFYLLFFRGTKGSRLVDIDFIPMFNYKIKPEIKFVELFPLGGKLAHDSVENVFQLQDSVFNKIFNGQLVTNTKSGGVWLKYFDDLEPNPKYFFTDAIYNLMMSFRKAIYDYVYKARSQSITCRMFDQMMKISILEDIRIDEYKNKKHSRGYELKEKLNIWFNLYNFFNQNKNRENMASRIPQLLEKMKQVANGENVSFSEDPSEFAFGAGQVVYFLLSKSESSDKTYAMLEPFLQKTTASQLQEAIGKTIVMYKHDITISKGRFEKLASEVLTYETNINMKDYLRYFLAGCFAQSVIYEKNSK